MAKDEDAVVEIKDESVKELDGGDEVEIEEDDSGIFDEDLVDDLGEIEEDLVLGEGVEGDDEFFIGDTILSSGDSEQSWSKEDLEEVIRNERIEKDWQDSEEFIGGDFYNAVNGGDFYGTEESRNGFYEDKSRGDDLYKGKNEGDLYNTGGEGVYTGKTNDEGVYDVGKRGMKSYDELTDNRRSGRSMLERAGFEDKEKQKHRDTHSLMKYDTKKAA